MNEQAELDKKILATWDLHDDRDISTERLLQMVADDCGCDTDRVVDALARDRLARLEEET